MVGGDVGSIVNNRKSLIQLDGTQFLSKVQSICSPSIVGFKNMKSATASPEIVKNNESKSELSKSVAEVSEPQTASNRSKYAQGPGHQRTSSR